MNFKKEKSGFTLIELIMVIIILGVLAAVAVPKFKDLGDSAKTSSEKGVVGGVRAGIQTYMAQHASYYFPSALDDHANSSDCSTTDPCFDNVLSQGGITDDDWAEGTDNLYTGPKNGSYLYSSATGSFTKQ